uniref:Rieske domain-containing protein n=1 Tax=Oryzias sinensis TaxID=183150 RepID=A0A8C7Y9E2_9TELE
HRNNNHLNSEMSAQKAKVVLLLDREAVDVLTDGVNFRKSPEGSCYIIFKSKDGLKACKNLCKHQGGLFIQDMEDMGGR